MHCRRPCAHLLWLATRAKLIFALVACCVIVPSRRTCDCSARCLCRLWVAVAAGCTACHDSEPP